MRFVLSRPGMFVHRGTFDALLGWLDGFDFGRDGDPLRGLQEWLIVRRDGGNNLAWSALIEDGIPPEAAGGRERIAALATVLDEFFEHRRHHGVAAILHAYEVWLRRQSWYAGPGRAAEQSRDRQGATE